MVISKSSQKNPGLTLDKYKKPKGQSSKDKIKFKKGMKVTWSHPKAGKGSGIISNISGNIASIDKVVGADGKPGKPISFPLIFETSKVINKQLFTGFIV